MARYTGIDWNNLEVAVPPKGDPVPPQPLPPAFANIAEQDAVDLRKYSTPIGDQGQTGRCSAFAWTHAAEMSRNILNEESPRLSPNFTMLEFQRMQGDARDYQYAYEGGDGTISGPDPGQVLVEYGTCRQELWPDDRPSPLTREEQLEADAQRYRLEAVPLAHRHRRCEEGSQRRLSGARLHEHGRRVFRRGTRWRVQCRRSGFGTAWPACHVDCRLRRKFLYAEEFMGNRMGRPGLLLRS